MTTVYFAGGEDTSMTAFGGATFQASGVRSAYSRQSFYVQYFQITTTMPPSLYFLTPVFTNVSSFWTHFQFSQNGATFTNTLNAPAFWLLDSSGLARIVVRGTGTAGVFKISTCNSSGTLVDLATSSAIPISANVPIAFDLFVNYAVSGQATLYANGVSVADTGTGVNVTTNSVTSLAQVGFQGLTTASGIGGPMGEVLVQDTSTIGCAVFTLVPQAAGNTQSWLPNTVGNINENAINDSNSISTVSVNALSEWTTVASSTFPGGSNAWALTAIVQNARVAIGTTGPQHFEWLCRTIDGSDHVTGSVAATSSFVNYSNIWALNPHTGSAWAIGDIASGFNLGIESLT